jgi:hypothetical protein
MRQSLSDREGELLAISATKLPFFFFFTFALRCVGSAAEVGLDAGVACIDWR